MPKAATATLVAKIKREAKQLARSGDIPHTEALERLATEAGHQSWHALLSASSAHAPSAEPSNPALPLDPLYPPAFDATPNDDRDEAEIQAWWDRPFAMTRPDGSLEVRCLDGGAWDRSTWYGVAPDMPAAVKLADEKLAWWRKTRDRPVTMMEDDRVSIVRMPSRPRESTQVLAVVPDFAAAREWLTAHGYTE